MGTEGQGTSRIMLVGRSSESRGEPRPPRPASGWTVRRLINGASLGGLATVAGGLVFQENFRLLGDDHKQLLAMGFGLFVVGMVVFELCLIGLAAVGVRSLSASRGWGVTVLAAVAPTLAFALLALTGVLSLAFPALFALTVAGGFALASKR